MKINLKILLAISILISLLYYIQLFVFQTILNFIESNINIKKSLVLFISIIILSVVSRTPFFIWKKIYYSAYYISTIYLGYICNSLLLCIIYRIINIFIHINNNFSSFLVLYFPIIISLYGIINAKIIRIEEVFIKSKKYKNNNSISLCHLTDLHLGTVFKKSFTQRIVNKIKNIIKPDIILITGDLFDNSNIPIYDFIEPFNEINVPILYATGNHEIMVGKNEVLKVLDKSKIKNIGNDLIPYIFKNINFIGIDFESKIERIKDIKYDKNMFNIVLNHVPISPKELSKYDIDLFLCGHTHGGQTFPFNVMTYFNAICYQGLYEYLNRYVYVSSGLGATLIPMRIGSKSVISVIKIESTD